MAKTLGLISALTLVMMGCGAATGTVESCNAGWTNYCAKLFNCDAQVTASSQTAFGSEAQCRTSFTAACAAVQYYSGTCATKYNTCVGSLKALTCADFTSGGSFDAPAECDDTGC
jgi:hypothetical protein